MLTRVLSEDTTVTTVLCIGFWFCIDITTQQHLRGGLQFLAETHRLHKRSREI